MAFALPPTVARAADAVRPALEDAARRTGVAFEALFHTARLESGFDPDARARTSSATGLFQFVERTWLDTLARHGPRHGITAASTSDALALRKNPAVAALMAAEHMGDNAARLQRATGRKPGTTELYLAHFLGAGGAAKFLGALDRAPDTPGIQLFPAAAKANRAIFFEPAGQPRTLAAIRNLIAGKLGLGDGAPPPAQTRSPALAAALRQASGTTVPQTGRTAGHLVPAWAEASPAHPLPDGLAARLAGVAAPDPALAAQAARLLLAELGI